MYLILRLLLMVSVLLVFYVLALTLCIVPHLWIAVAVIGILLLRQKSRYYTAYGTARWAGISDVSHMLEGDGLIVGQIEDYTSKKEGMRALFNFGLSSKKACQRFLAGYQKKRPKYFVRLTNAVHTAVFAPTGVGKGVSFVVPHLLSCRESMVVLDFKGENAEITAKARRRMGHKTVFLDPYKMTTQHPDCFNPLDLIDSDSPTALDDCRDLAEALVVRTGQEKEPHWADSAEVWITAMIAVVVCFAEGAERNLQSVRGLLTNPDKMQAAIKMMCESDRWEGMLSRLGYQLTHYRDKELASTLTTTNRFLNFLDTIAISENTRESTFNPADLLKGKMTVYLILPPQHARTQSPLLRLWIGSLLRVIVKGGIKNRNKVNFLLDEAASLGHMAVLDDAVDKYRAYAIRLIFLYQSLGQLKKCWPEGAEQTLLSNVTQVFFGVQDQQTADYVSTRLGEETIIVDSGGTSTSRSWSSSQQSNGGSSGTSYSQNSNYNWQQHGRKLLKPEEVTGLSERVAIIFTPGVPPIWTELIRYYERDFKHRSGLGFVKTSLDSISLFILTVIFAAFCTHVAMNIHINWEVNHVKENQRIFRPAQGR